MEDKPLPKIAIIGAGPIGIEAALYARYLGYPTAVFEQSDICQHVNQWRDVQMFSPFGLNCSPLGLAALSAQNIGYRPPGASARVTGRQWIDDYLGPLSETDLIADCFQPGHRVDMIGRCDQLKTDNATQPEQDDTRFRFEVVDEKQNRRIESANVLLDATGTFGTSNWLGNGGVPALGERPLREKSQLDTDENNLFSYRIPALEKFRRLSGNRYLVIGSGYSAATNVMRIVQLRETNAQITCLWLTRHCGRDEPLRRIANDPLAHRDELAAQANETAVNSPWLSWMPGVSVESIHLRDGQFQVALSNDSTVEVDHILANVGFSGDYSMLEALQVHRCYASGGPMAWAASIADSAGDCLQQQSSGPEAIATTEPNFFIIGSKTYGRDPRFLFSVGLQQIRDVFKLVTGRATMDLYENMRPNVASLLGSSPKKISGGVHE